MSENNLNLSSNATIIPIGVAPRNNAIIYYFLPIYAILFLTGTFGNGLVFLSIIRSSRLRTVTNTYLLNIAIADILLLLSIPFLIVTILANGWIFGNVLCKMYYNFIHINQYVSSLLLAALSFDRYLAVCHPIRAIEFRTRAKCVLIIAGCWLVSVLFLCPTWVFATTISERHIFWYGYRVQKCVIDFPPITLPIPTAIVFTYYAFLLGFLLPVSMITTFYLSVLVRLYHIRRKHQSQIKQRAHRKVTRVVLAVITAYFICWVPYWFLQIFITIDPLIHSLRLNVSNIPSTRNIRFLKELIHLTTVIGYANNCLNPVLYVFLSDSFREEYLLVLHCFHLNSTTQKKNNTPESNLQQQELKLKLNASKSVRKRKADTKAIKKARHSVAYDDVSTEYRSFSFRFRRSKDQKRQTNNSTAARIREHEDQSLEHSSLSLKSSTPRQRSFKNKSSESAAKTTILHISADPTCPSISITDDGGVYCGD